MQESYQFHRNSSHPLLRAIYSTINSHHAIPMLILKCIMIVLTLYKPFVVRYLLSSIGNEQMDIWECLGWIALLTIVTGVLALTTHHFWVNTKHICVDAFPFYKN
jgi:hypothetical protein